MIAFRSTRVTTLVVCFFFDFNLVSADSFPRLNEMTNVRRPLYGVVINCGRRRRVTVNGAAIRYLCPPQKKLRDKFKQACIKSKKSAPFDVVESLMSVTSRWLTTGRYESDKFIRRTVTRPEKLHTNKFRVEINNAITIME